MTTTAGPSVSSTPSVDATPSTTTGPDRLAPRLRRPSVTELALVALGAMSTTKLAVGGVRLSYVVVAVVVGCLWARYCLGQQNPRIRTNGLLTGGMMIFTGGLVATVVAGGGASQILAGVQSIIGGMVLSILVVWVARQFGCDTRYVLVGIVLGGCLNLGNLLLAPTRDVSGRIEGFNHPNQTGLALVLAILALWIIRQDLPWRWARSLLSTMAVSGLLIYGITMTGSRSAILGLVAAMGWFIFGVRRPLAERLAFVAVAGVVVAIVVYSFLQTPLGLRLDPSSTNAESSNQDRTTLIEEQIEVARERPVLGSGFEYRTAAHTVPLQIWNTAGLLGLAGLVLVVASLVRTMVLTRRQRSPGVQLVGSLIVAILVIWLVQNTFFDQVVWLAIAGATLFSLESRASSGRVSSGRISSGRISSGWNQSEGKQMTELPGPGLGGPDLGGAGHA